MNGPAESGAVTRALKIVNEKGLHARASAKFVAVVEKFKDTASIKVSKGDEADTMFYIASGSFIIPELGIDKVPGEFVGELGLLAPDHRRTQSLQCVSKV